MTTRPFRFAPLLSRAEQREEQQTLELAAVVAEEREVRRVIAALHAEREHQWAQFTRRTGPLDAEQHRTAVAYVDRLTQRIDEQLAALADVQRRVAEARDVLLETLREKRSLEHLKDRDAAAAAQEADRREAGRQDDLNMSRHARRAAHDGDGRAGSGGE